MAKVRTSLKRHKHIYLFLIIILIFGVISGILFYFNQDLGVQKNIIANMGDIFSHNVFSIKSLLTHIGLILSIIAASFIFLGLPIVVIALFFEGISIGFLIPIFLNVFKWKFFYTFGIYLLLIKLIYIILLSGLFVVTLSFFKKYILHLKNKKNNFFIPLKKMFIIGLFIVMNDLIIYFCFNKVLIFLLG